MSDRPMGLDVWIKAALQGVQRACVNANQQESELYELEDDVMWYVLSEP